MTEIQPQNLPGPVLHCPRLTNFDAPPRAAVEWRRIEQAFAIAASCQLGQAWRDVPEPRFQPTTVRVGWQPDALWVYAEMRDLDIGNAARSLNEHTWETGDVFEIFLRPWPAVDWFEFHVTPENQRLQLHFPIPTAEFMEIYPTQGMRPFYMEGEAVQSWALARPEEQRWSVLARVPAATVLRERIAGGDEWLFSFCRYDYTTGQEIPVISSTSMHCEVLLFNRQQEWGRLVFDG